MKGDAIAVLTLAGYIVPSAGVTACQNPTI